jgi:hypothetical protein
MLLEHGVLGYGLQPLPWSNGLEFFWETGNGETGVFIDKRIMNSSAINLVNTTTLDHWVTPGRLSIDNDNMP